MWKTPASLLRPNPGERPLNYTLYRFYIRLNDRGKDNESSRSGKTL